MEKIQRTVKTIIPKAMTGEIKVPVIRTAAYCRVSSDSREQEQSFEAQVKYYTEAVGKIPNAVLVDVYADDAVSGRGTAKREDFNRLMADCRKGKIDRILTKSVSRFARNTVDCLQTVRQLSEMGITILFEKEQIDTETMSSEVLLAMSGTQAQDESISHGNNMKWSYTQRMKRGEFVGCKSAYGYNLIDSATVVVNREEAKVIQRIVNMYLDGMGKYKIANQLNAEGIPTRAGGRWNASAIYYILNNERYVGDALLQKYITTPEYPPRKTMNRGTQAQYYVANCVPAIISQEQWDAVQSLQAGRKPKSCSDGNHPLSKLLRCADCGNLYRRLICQTGAVWKCSIRTSGRGDCKLISVREDDMCRVLVNAINKLYINKKTILEPLMSRVELMLSRMNQTTEKVYEIDKEIAVLSRQSLTVAELLSLGILDPVDFTAQNNELNERISKLRSKRRDILRQNDTDDLLSEIRGLNDIIADMDGELTDYDEDLIRAIVNHVTVESESSIIIHLKGGLSVREFLPQYYSTRRCNKQC